MAEKYFSVFMRTIVFVFLIIVTNSRVNAIGGISGTKLIVPSAIPIDEDQFEFDLAYAMYRAEDEYNAASQRQSASSYSESVISFRGAFGFTDLWEFGVTFGSVTSNANNNRLTLAQFSDMQFGSKYLAYDTETISFSPQIGLNIDVQTQSPAYQGGFLFTYNFTKNFSIDFDIAWYYTPRSIEPDQGGPDSGPAGAIGIGYQIWRLQPVLEISVLKSRYLRTSTTDYFERFKVQGTYGILYDANQLVTLTLYVSHDMVGMNAPAGTAISGAFTMKFDDKHKPKIHNVP